MGNHADSAHRGTIVRTDFRMSGLRIASCFATTTTTNINTTMDAKWQADRLSLQGELPSPSQRRSALAASLSSPPRITFWAGLLSVAVVILMGQKLYAELDTIDDAYMRWSYSRADLDPTSDNGICAQQAPYKPTFEIAPHPGVDVLAQRLSGAIRVDTSVGDDWPKVSDDPEKWAKVLDPFRDYLKNTFPKVHSQDSPLTLELVNDQGLLYTWKGSDEKLKPLLLLGHQGQSSRALGNPKLQTLAGRERGDKQLV